MHCQLQTSQEVAGALAAEDFRWHPTRGRSHFGPKGPEWLCVAGQGAERAKWPFQWAYATHNSRPRCRKDAKTLKSSGFKKALLQNPREMIRGQIFSGMIRIQARKSEIQAGSRSYRPETKSRRYSPESEPNRPEKGPEWGLGASAENPPSSPLEST